MLFSKNYKSSSKPSAHFAKRQQRSYRSFKDWCAQKW